MVGASKACIAAAFLLHTVASSSTVDVSDEVLAAGDECSQSTDAQCALSALQLKGEKVGTLAWKAAEVERIAERARLSLQPQLRYNSSAAGSLKAPVMATQYDGIEDTRLLQVRDTGFAGTHIFVIGDWGAILPKHYTAPNSRGHGHRCPGNCGYVRGVDDQAQILVADVMKNLAQSTHPQYVLNVGDNFYWGGIEEDCNNTATEKTFTSFSTGWQTIYGDLVNIPWLSTLGNHDYGGFQFNRGWPQQIAYSFVNQNWVMPGRYYSRKMYHQGFTMEYFIIDSNAWDAKDPSEDPLHNICSNKHIPATASCAAAGGPASVNECKQWFWSTYQDQKAWMRAQIAASNADWQVVVTHFPCGHEIAYYADLHQNLGLDFLVTGHRHDQELWANSGPLGGLSCIVSGGGGGITSERSPGGLSSSQYGFFDLTVTKDAMNIELYALNGQVIKQAVIHPVPKGLATQTTRPPMPPQNSPMPPQI